MGLVSKKILEKINEKITSLTLLIQWKITASVINWFNNIPNKANSVFIVFDIESFYPSISEELLKMSINYAKQFINIPEQDIDIIMHSRKSLLFHQDAAWVKKGDSGLFDVTIGSYDGAEVCELVRLYILNRLSEKYDKESTGLYRDDGAHAWIIRNRRPTFPNRRPTFPSSSPPDLEVFKRGNEMKMSQQAGSNSRTQSHYSLSHGFWQSFVTIRYCNCLVKIVPTYVGNFKEK